jgi:hypothetical protein
VTREGRAREYLLGTLAEEERDALENEYFAAEAGLDRVAAAEDELIEDYLDGRLSDEERTSFEDEYLASAAHRVRVEAIRRLTERAKAAGASPATRERTGWFALAAAAVLVVAAGFWVLNQRVAPPSPAPTAAGRPASQPSAPAPSEVGQPAAAPVIFAIELTPLAIRGAGDTPRFTIPAGTDLVELALDAPEGSRSGSALSVTVATVSGDEVYRGPATAAALSARARVPANALPPDDYIVTLRVGRVETRYFLRIRAPR